MSRLTRRRAVRSGSAPAFRARAPQQVVCGTPGSGRGTLTVGKGYNARVCRWQREAVMNGLIYLIGLIVVIMAILSFLGLH